jgi:hypothetical protein
VVVLEAGPPGGPAAPSWRIRLARDEHQLAEVRRRDGYAGDWYGRQVAVGDERGKVLGLFLECFHQVSYGIYGHARRLHTTLAAAAVRTRGIL